jgi:hypothetical protein
MGHGFIATEGINHGINAGKLIGGHGALYLTKRESVKPQEVVIGLSQSLSTLVPMVERRETGGQQSPSARRFRAVMKATRKPGETGTQWAYRMGLGPTAVSNFRNGIPVSAMAADKIAARTGIGSDYLRRGDERFLTVDMQRRIQAAMEAPDDPGEPNDPGEADLAGA